MSALIERVAWKLTSVDCSLRTRLLVMGHLNFLFAPFIILYLVMYSFFRYFEVRHETATT